ncbi:hypothetical protein ACFE04_025220 [Oxalis oulophora]
MEYEEGGKVAYAETAKMYLSISQVKELAPGSSTSIVVAPYSNTPKSNHITQPATIVECEAHVKSLPKAQAAKLLAKGINKGNQAPHHIAPPCSATLQDSHALSSILVMHERPRLPQSLYRFHFPKLTYHGPPKTYQGSLLPI